MSSARSQVARLMALAPYLRARPDGVPLAELAEEFGVTAATMRRDLQTLVMCGLPELLPDDLIDIDLEAFETDPDGIVRIHNADFMARPTRLSSGEAASLLVALESMRDESDPESLALIGQIQTKLEQAAAEGATGRASVLPTYQPSDLPALTATIESAITADRQVRIAHLNANRDELTERVLDPVGVFARDGRSYVDAWCHRSDDRRIFRLDRIQSATQLDSPRVHADLAPRSPDESVYEAGGDVVVARLRLAPEARWIVSYHPILSSHEGGNGHLEVTLQVSDPLWLLRLVLSQAPHIEVLEPAEYSEMVAEEARSALAAYDDQQ